MILQLFHMCLPQAVPLPNVDCLVKKKRPFLTNQRGNKGRRFCLKNGVHRCRIWNNREKFCCEKYGPCGEGIGWCRSDDECAGDLQCNVKMQGHAHGYPGQYVSVCGKPNAEETSIAEIYEGGSKIVEYTMVL